MTRARSSPAFVLILVAAAWALSLGLWRLAAWVHAETGDSFPRADHLAFAATVALGVVVILAVLLRLEGSRPASLGLRQPGRGLATGALWYAIPAVIGVVVAVLAGWMQVGLVDGGADAVLKLLALAGLVLLSEALPEELIFRGFIQSRLGGALGTWGALLGQAVLFTVFAILLGSAPGPMDMGFIFFFGLALGVLRAATGSLWASVGFHWLFMTVQQAHGGGWDLLSLAATQMVQMVVLTNAPFGVVIALLFSRVSAAKAG